MKVCAITSQLPIPVDNGDAVRVKALLQTLAGEHQLTVYAVSRRDSTDAHAKELERLLGQDATVQVFQPARLAGPVRLPIRLLRLLAAVMWRVPPQVLTVYSAALRKCLKRNVRDFDCVVLIGEPAGVYASDIPGNVHAIWDKANVFTTSFRLAAREANSVFSWVYSRVNAVLAARFEKTTIAGLNQVWVTSADERGRLNSLGWFLPTVTVVPTVQPPNLTRPISADPTGSFCVWVSTFGYPPNWEGLRRFLEEAGQDIDKAGLRLRVIGKGATPSQETYLRKFTFVDYLGFQSDLEPVLDGARAAIVPVWVGGGVKLKTLLYLNAGIPVVSTKQGAEGIDQSVFIRVDDDSQSLVKAIVETDVQEWERVRAAAGDWLRIASAGNLMSEAIQRSLSTVEDSS